MTKKKIENHTIKKETDLEIIRRIDDSYRHITKEEHKERLEKMLKLREDINSGKVSWDLIDQCTTGNLMDTDKLLKLIQKEKQNKLKFIKLDLLNLEDLNKLFGENQIDIVIHLAGYKAVSESVSNPILYYENNLISTINLLNQMKKHKCFNLIFSSSSTVYGNLKAPYNETMHTGQGITNPYGKSKYFQEEFLKDLSKSDNKWNIIILRYFNPIGHKNNLLKEEPNGIPNNLFPYLVKVFNNELPILNIFGNDYNTRDGTCIRDFIHVVDLALAHVSSCNYIIANKNCGLKIYNIGMANGISVLELINAFEIVNNTKLNYKFVERRPGDLDISFADCSLAKNELKWSCIKSIEDLVKL